MIDSLDPTSPGFVGGRSFAFWRHLAGLPDGPPPVATPAPAGSEKPPEHLAASEPLTPTPG